MWPIQTITLLLCLTDDEQLFAQCMAPDPEIPAIEVEASPEEETPALAIDLALTGDR